MIAGRGKVFEKAVTKVRYFSADEQTRWQIESYEKARRDEQMRINDAFEDGEAKGKAEGKIEGRAEGRAEGIDEGRAEGIAVGEANGELKTYIELVRDDLMEPSVAAARLRISESEFRAKCDAAPIS